MALLVMGGCAQRIPTPTPVPPPAMRAVGALVRNLQNGVVEASCSIQTTSDSWLTATANPTDGYLVWPQVPSSLSATLVECQAPGYVPLVESRVLTSTTNEDLVTLVMVADHVDPSVFSLPELAAIRGAMWPLGTAASCGLVPLGPRPNQPDNVIATDFILNYSPEMQTCIMEELQARGYTHVVMGPLVDSDGYHGMWQPTDWRGENFSRFLDAIQNFEDHHLHVVVFIHPDGWTFEQTRDELTPLLLQPRAQRLIRIAVGPGWEPTKYDWSSYTWALYGQWIRTVLPNALSLLHTVCDVDAPVGTDARGDDNGTGNQTGWARVAPFYHGWLTQSCAFESPDVHGDANHPDQTNFQNWTSLFNPSIRGSYQDRFQHGYAGWPQSSAWGEGQPLKVYAAEYSAYWKFWHHRTEAEAVIWGNAAMAAGADGYLDSGSTPVPIAR